MRVIVFHNDEPVKTYEFNEFPLTVGRLQENQIPIADINISRRHVSINRPAPGRYTVTDLNSLNGTFLNKDRISGEATLSDGDRIILGNFSLEVRLPQTHDTLAVVEDTSWTATVPAEPPVTAAVPVPLPVAAPASFIEPVAPATPQPVRIPEPVAAEPVPAPIFDVPAQEPPPPALDASSLVFTSVPPPAPVPVSPAPAVQPEMDLGDHEAVLIDTDQHIVYKLEKEITSIGNADSDDIFVDGMWIADNHIVVERQVEGYWINAKKKMGKFKVNGEKATRQQLIHKDRIEIGNCTFRFMENGQKNP